MTLCKVKRCSDSFFLFFFQPTHSLSGLISLIYQPPFQQQQAALVSKKENCTNLVEHQMKWTEKMITSLAKKLFLHSKLHSEPNLN